MPTIQIGSHLIIKLKIPRGLKCVRLVPSLRDLFYSPTFPSAEALGYYRMPLGGLLIFHFVHPRLAPWAAFLRRFAAEPRHFIQPRSPKSSSHAHSKSPRQGLSG